MSDSSLNILKDGKWYEQGVPFQCTECGQCCTGSPGYVWINEEEIAAIADFLKISIDTFSQLYLRKIGSRFSLKENAKTYDCVFLKGSRCTIYDLRPTQCRTYPWWPQHLKDAQSWKEAAAHCEGMRQEGGPVVPFEEINRQLQLYRDKHPHDPREIQ